jgi:D-Tyr-tRNAtyr deacylase
VLKGNKPDFHNALTSEQSEPMYQDFLKLLGSMHRADAIKGESEGKERCHFNSRMAKKKC